MMMMRKRRRTRRIRMMMRMTIRVLEVSVSSIGLVGKIKRTPDNDDNDEICFFFCKVPLHKEIQQQQNSDGSSHQRGFCGWNHLYPILELVVTRPYG